jgi:anhydro-N-acetylmuramic acid kinase
LVLGVINYQLLIIMIVIGLMSGTSVDGIDAAVLEIKGKELDLEVNLISGQTFPYPENLRKQILAVCEGASLSMFEFAKLDDAIATQFALAANNVTLDNLKVDLIGSHGQTVYHRPANQNTLGYSLQLGRGDLIAKTTGITTISNFRVADIAVGGQGAPLVPKIDLCLFSHSRHNRCIQNIGGISNVTYIPSQKNQNWQNQVIGWDTGPGNALIDLAVQKLTDGKQTFDINGNWSRQGTPCTKLVEKWLKQDFFHQLPPKSTGRELFGSEYLEKCWAEATDLNLTEADWLATLTELTVMSIVDSYQRFLPHKPDEVLLCGGGSRNLYLKERLQNHLQSIKVLATDEVGISSEFKEAIAFGILAYWRIQSYPGNLPQVTGATKSVLLGEIHLTINNY